MRCCLASPGRAYSQSRSFLVHLREQVVPVGDVVRTRRQARNDLLQEVLD